LLQIGVEPFGSGPIYPFMSPDAKRKETPMQSEAILKFLADSSRYFSR
jgi:hypothetical protein